MKKIDLSKKTKEELIRFIELAKTSDADMQTKEIYIAEAMLLLTDRETINNKILQDILDGQSEISLGEV